MRVGDDHLDEYFTDPSCSRSQFAGLRLFPTSSWALNRLAFHPDPTTDASAS
jgi:hypothetical protein